ncbi:MAG: hypothetical protein Kow0037_17820 [Calditrichia bacterium]
MAFLPSATAAFTSNPSLFLPNKKSISLAYTTPFQISELQAGAMAISYSSSQYNTGFAITNLGTSIYRETTAFISFAKAFLNGQLSLGINLSLRQINVQNYGGYITHGMDVGFSYYPNQWLGFHTAINNFNHPKLGRYQNEIPLRYSSGVNILAEENAVLVAGLEKESGYAPTFLFGILYQATRQISLSSSWCTNPSTPSIGLLINLSPFSFIYTFKYNFNLSYTHIWGFSATF